MKTSDKKLQALKKIISEAVQEAVSKNAMIVNPDDPTLIALRAQLAKAGIAPVKPPRDIPPTRVSKAVGGRSEESPKGPSKQNVRFFTPEETEALRKAAAILAAKS